MPEDASVYHRFTPHNTNETFITPSTQALCLIVNDLDELTHSAHLGARDAQASLRLWLRQHAGQLETLLQSLLDKGFSIFLASDHGHTEAVGIGQPSEGLIVQTRSKRARTYRDHNLALHVQNSFPGTFLWHKDGLLPDDLWVLTPDRRGAFISQGKVCVTHGGLSLDEVIVPLVHLKQK